MSRSKKKTAAGGVTGAPSEKDDKKAWHKTFRRKNKSLARRDGEDTEIIYPHVWEVSDLWRMDKDGKIRYDKNNEAKKRK